MIQLSAFRRALGQQSEAKLRIVRWIALGVTALVLILIGTGRYHGPAYRSDEIGYLSKAAVIAGKTNVLASSWHGGYGIFLSPFFLVARSVREAWPGVILLNVASVMAAVAGYWGCLERTGLCTRRQGFQVMCLTLLSFGTTAYTGWAFTNCLLMAVIAAAAWALSGSSSNSRDAVCVGLLGGLAYWIHPTGLIVLASASLAFAIGGKSGRRSLDAAVVLVAGGGVAWLYSSGVHPWLTSLQGGGTGHYVGQVSGYIAQLQSQPFNTLSTVATAVVNGVATSMIATLGYLSAAGLALSRGLRRRIQQWSPGSVDTISVRKVLIFLLSSWAGLVLFSALLSIGAPDDFQHAFHQRYTHPVLLGILAFGLALAPSGTAARIQSTLLSALPIAASLLIAMFGRNYIINLSVVDAIGANTIFLAPENIPAMLAVGMAFTAFVQILGRKGYIPIAGFLWLIGWGAMDKIHRSILASNSRIPEFAVIAGRLRDDKLSACIDLTEKPWTPNDYSQTMGYYLSGLGHRITGASPMPDGNSTPPPGCDTRIRPVDPDIVEELNRSSTASGLCRIRLFDPFANYLLEECGTSAIPDEVFRELLLPPSSLVNIEEVIQRTPLNHTLVALTHISELAPKDWVRSAIIQQFPVQLKEGQSLLHGPYWSLPPGKYQAVLDGPPAGTGSATLRAEVTIGKGKIRLADVETASDSSIPAITFQLRTPVDDLEIRMFAVSGGQRRLPTSVAIYREDPKAR